MTSFWILFGVIVVVLIAEEVGYLRPERPVLGVRPESARLAQMALIVPAIGIALTAAIGILFGQLWGFGVINALGVILAVGGIALRAWSRRIFSAIFPIGNVGLSRSRRRMRVVNTGPYRLLRHPGYLGFLLVYLGLPMVIGVWAGFIVLTIPAIALFVRLIYAEERDLSQILGNEYRQYQTRTERLVPGFW